MTSAVFSALKRATGSDTEIYVLGSHFPRVDESLVSGEIFAVLEGSRWSLLLKDVAVLADVHAGEDHFPMGFEQRSSRAGGFYVTFDDGSKRIAPNKLFGILNVGLVPVTTLLVPFTFRCSHEHEIYRMVGLIGKMDGKFVLLPLKPGFPGWNSENFTIVKVLTLKIFEDAHPELVTHPAWVPMYGEEEWKVMGDYLLLEEWRSYGLGDFENMGYEAIMKFKASSMAQGILDEIMRRKNAGTWNPKKAEEEEETASDAGLDAQDKSLDENTFVGPKPTNLFGNKSYDDISEDFGKVKGPDVKVSATVGEGMVIFRMEDGPGLKLQPPVDDTLTFVKKMRFETIPSHGIWF